MKSENVSRARLPGRSNGLRIGLRLAMASIAFVAASGTASRADAFCRTSTEGLGHECTVTESECCTRGRPLYWAEACVGYSFSTAGSRKLDVNAVRPMLRNAFARWSGAPCGGGLESPNRPSINVYELPDTDIDSVSYNKDGPNANVVLFRDDAWPHDDETSTLELVTLVFDAQTGQIFGADIEINTSVEEYTLVDPLRPDELDLDTVLTHAAGHFLGLAHSADTTATMYQAYEMGTTDMRSLSPDDMLGICAAYPPDGTREGGARALTQSCATPRGGLDLGVPSVSHGCSMGSRAGMEGSTTHPENAALAFVGLAGIVARARSRARRSR